MSRKKRERERKNVEYINNWHNIDLSHGYGYLKVAECWQTGKSVQNKYSISCPCVCVCVESRSSVQKNQAMEKHMQKRFRNDFENLLADIVCHDWTRKRFETPLSQPSSSSSFSFFFFILIYFYSFDAWPGFICVYLCRFIYRSSICNVNILRLLNVFAFRQNDGVTTGHLFHLCSPKIRFNVVESVFFFWREIAIICAVMQKRLGQSKGREKKKME